MDSKSVSRGLLTASALVLYAHAGAQSPEPPAQESKRARVVRTETPPTIDGRMDEALWSQATPIEDLHQVSPIEYAEASVPTAVYLLSSADALYVGARLWDDGDEGPTARILRQGEGITIDDVFMVVLDPFLDRRSGYRFALNPNGVREDLLFQNTTQQQLNWEGIWRGAAHQDEMGWSVEMEIPYKTLSFNPERDTWGMNFVRFVPKRNEWIAWASRNRTTNPSVAGIAEGFEGLDQGLGLDVVPSISLRGQRTFFPAASSDSDAEPSLDIFYKLTPALNASFTVNTDFSATEVDDRQVDLSRFTLFFPEKRAFFLRDSDIFEFGRLGPSGEFSAAPTFSRPSLENGRPFFSRLLGLSASGAPVDLEYGGKLSGRVGRWNVGALAVRQDAFQTIDATNVFVGRAVANVLEESALGVLVTRGDPLSNLENDLLGVDFRYFNSRLPGGRQIQGEAWYQQSDTDGMDGDDAAWGLRVRSPNRVGLRGGIGIKQLERNFNPALGFVNRRNIRDTTMELGHTRWPGGGWVQAIYHGVDVQQIDLLDGGLQSEVLTFRPLEIETSTSELINLRYTSNREAILTPFEISEGIFIPPGLYSFDEHGFDLETGNQRVVSGKLNYRIGEFYDGDRLMARGELTWAPSKHFRTRISYDYNDVDLPQGDFIVRLVTLKADVVFSSTLSWVNLIQYDNVSETAGINSRLHWIPEAGREAYIVLNHNLEDRDRDDSFHSESADLVVKFNYTFRF